MEQQGLAASVAPQQGGGQLPIVDEVIQLLIDGTAPEELEQMGIPPELIMEAIQILEQQMSQQQSPAQQQQMGGGLAQSAVGV